MKKGPNECGYARMVGGRPTLESYDKKANLGEFYDMDSHELVGLTSEDGLYSIYTDKNGNMVEETCERINGRWGYYRVVKDSDGRLKSLSSTDCSSFHDNSSYHFKRTPYYDGFKLTGSGSSVKEKPEKFMVLNNIHADWYNDHKVASYNENYILRA